MGWEGCATCRLARNGGGGLDVLSDQQFRVAAGDQAEEQQGIGAGNDLVGRTRKEHHGLGEHSFQLVHHALRAAVGDQASPDKDVGCFA